MPKAAADKPAIENQAGLAWIQVPPKNRLALCKQALLCEIIAEVETPPHLLALQPSLPEILVPALCEITAHRGNLLGIDAITPGANNEQDERKASTT